MSTTITNSTDVLPATEAGNGSSPSSRRSRGSARAGLPAGKTGQPSPYSDSRRLTDDEILGLADSGLVGARYIVPGEDAWRDVPHSSSPSNSSTLSSRVSPPQADDEESLFASDTTRRTQDHAAETAPEPPALRATIDANPDLRRAWHDAQAYRETFATPEEARAATALLADLDRMDALFFSHHPEDHAELARAVASLDPSAFASLAHAMNTLAAESQSHGARRQGSNEAGNHDLRSAPRISPVIPNAPRNSGAEESALHPPGENQEQIPRPLERTRNDSPRGFGSQVEGRDFSPATNGPREARSPLPARAEGARGDRSEAVAQAAGPEQHTFGASPAQLEFFHSANASAVKNVLDAIESQVERLLPESVSKSARNRVVGEIYRELDTTLRSNRQLAQQMRDAFRSGSHDAAHERAIVSLITGRARQAIPAVAKRVLNEWTSTLVAANHDRRARQRAAERRVDIAGSGGASNDGIRPTTPRDIDYSRLSDSDILNL